MAKNVSSVNDVRRATPRDIFFLKQEACKLITNVPLTTIKKHNPPKCSCSERMGCFEPEMNQVIRMTGVQQLPLQPQHHNLVNAILL